MSQIRAMMMQYMPMMVTCEEADQFLDDYLGGELPRRQQLVFEWHMRLCTGCKDYLERYRRSITLCQKNFHGGKDDSEEVPEQILKGIVAAKRAAGK